MNRSRRRPKAWLLWGLFAEALILLLSYMAYTPNRLQHRMGREGNRIARLVLGDPGILESLAFYMVLFNAVIAGLLFVAHLSARRKARARQRR